jgi:2-hydroxychromene-2-carboxylate isomerase
MCLSRKYQRLGSKSAFPRHFQILALVTDRAAIAQFSKNNLEQYEKDFFIHSFISGFFLESNFCAALLSSF